MEFVDEIHNQRIPKSEVKEENDWPTQVNSSHFTFEITEIPDETETDIPIDSVSYPSKQPKRSKKKLKLSTVEFIKLMKENRILWDTSHPNYRVIKEKAPVWKKISIELGFPIELCKKRWKSLRDTYQRDLNPKFDRKKKEYKTAWKYRTHMEFMREILKTELPKIEFVVKNELIIPDEENSLSFDSITHPMETSNKTIPSFASDVGEDELFVRTLLEKIKRLPRDIQDQTKDDLLRYVNEVESFIKNKK